MNKYILFSLLVGAVVSSISLAETIQIERFSTVTLSILTETVYQRNAAHHNESAKQQQINVNTEIANRFFADANTLSINHENDLITHSDGFQEWELGVDMPLWLPGQQQQKLSLSEKMSAVLPASQQQIKLDASETVRDLVWAIVINKTDLEQAKQAWQTAQELESDVVLRVESGDLAGMDRLLANTHVLDMNKQAMIAEAELEYSLEIYSKITGKQALPEQYREVLSNKTVIDQSHPSLGLLQQKIATLIAKQSLAQYNGVTNPNLSVGIRSERDDDHESFQHSIALGLSFALNGTVYSKPAVADAAKKLADAEIDYQNLEWQLNVILSEQLHDLELKKQQLELMIERDKITQQYLLLQQRAFDLGEIDLVSLLRSRVLADESRNQKQSMEISMQRSISMVNQALGIIL